jgi:isoleucyl-tRNA synthetase
MADKALPATQKKSETALREEEVASYWKSHRIFEQALAQSSPKGEFVFYDGPPFATGLPHMGHLLSSSIKDVVGRYKTMQGYHVARTWGWDTHGLPIENIVEKKLALKSKKDIEAMGIDAFNAEARKTVLSYVEDWKQYVERIGRWVDFDHSYKTMDNSYVESVWWALKKIHTDKRLYEGKKVLMYCPHCETPLSKAEIAMDNSYKDVTDEAVYVKFKLKEHSFSVEGPVYVLAWTTTPWTLPANMALAVGPHMSYVLAKTGSETLFVAKERMSVLGDGMEIVQEVQGADLVGLEYEPLYDITKARTAGSEKVWTVLSADFVTTEDGTGVVHIAPMYGEDDYELGKKHELPMVQLLDATGTYNDDAPELVRGMYYKKGGKHVTEDLTERGLLFAKHSHAHSYPHCYRCGTALIYNALTSWFIDIQSVKKRLLESNEAVAWYPEHLKEGRFKHIVEGAPDWTISRNRFWASPLPIWKHEKTGEVTVIGSLGDLRAHTKKSGNRYLFMRHGEAENNVAQINSTVSTEEYHLTSKGKEQIIAAVESLRTMGVTKIVTSPFVRTRESAELIAELLGYDKSQLEVEDRLGEWRLGVLNGKPYAENKVFYPVYQDRFFRAPEGGETMAEMKHRVGEALYNLEEKYGGETILVVTHECAVWLAECVARGLNIQECLAIRATPGSFTANGEVQEVEFVPLPHNADYELDLHRPYIDELPLVAKDGARLVRIPEVVDCWVESGLMPIASQHVLGEPFEKPARYPGDFIAEYIAQTRTWFYYMHAMGVLLFDGPSFTNCVTTGTILAEDGSKMSKSKGNYTDPLINLDRYGADALRLYMLGSVVMQSEDMSFRDEELKDVHNRTIGILWNTYKFYDMYVDAVPKDTHRLSSTHILDTWVQARLAQVTAEVTSSLDRYDTIHAIRTLRECVTDVSTWYVRRSRDRFKSEDMVDRASAIATTRHALLTLAKLFAPLAPFIAESIYRGVGGEKESVHLEVWPETAPQNDEWVLSTMEATRELVSRALELRSKAGIKIRQPLASLTIPQGVQVYEELVCDELNVKTIIHGADLALDTAITPELKQEGDIREFVRAVQDMRKKAGLMPAEKITLTVHTDETGRALLAVARHELERVAGVVTITNQAITEGGTVIGEGGTFTVMIEKQ